MEYSNVNFDAINERGRSGTLLTSHTWRFHYNFLKIIVEFQWDFVRQKCVKTVGKTLPKVELLRSTSSHPSPPTFEA